jgi:endo-chitodextinase
MKSRIYGFGTGLAAKPNALNAPSKKRETPMKKDRNRTLGAWTPSWSWIFAGACVWLLVVFAVPARAQVPVAQFERANNSATFFTANAEEAKFVEATLASAYASRGIVFSAWTEPKPDTVPVYRFYNPVTLAHFFTANAAERETLVQTAAGRGWIYEGISFYAYTQPAPERIEINRIWFGEQTIHRYTVGPMPVFSPALPASVKVEGAAFYGLRVGGSTVPKAGRDAARFLTQSTFGVQSSAQVQALEREGYATWLNNQFALPQSSVVQYLRDVEARGERIEEQHPYEGVWQQLLLGDDQLRARITFALSQVMVVSNIAPDQNNWALASWWDMLGKNAFGNYRQLLEDVTLHPAMGYYLNMMGNQKEDPSINRNPNENFAREVLQLFSIGLNELNADGSVKRNASGQTIPTYDQKTVEALAKVFTGWNHGGNDTTKAETFFNAKEAWLQPMQAWPAHHSAGEKVLFGNVKVPTPQTPEQDLKIALDTIANHPNVGPFIGRRLIQALVTSNPSPAYIARVTAAFDNNGAGVRGDMKAVIRAVLLDAEARNVPSDASKYGKLREPVLRFTQLLRGTGAKAANGRNSIWWLDSADDGMGQSPLLSPSVFNFFSPNYTRAGAIAQAGLVAPEFQITTETQIVGSTNYLHNTIYSGGAGFREEGRLNMDFTPYTALQNQPAALVDALALVYTNGQLSDSTRTIIVDAVTKLGTEDHLRTKAALILLTSSPDFVVQR